MEPTCQHNSAKNDLLRRIAGLAIGDDQKDDLIAEFNRQRKTKTGGRFEEVLDLPWGVFSEAKPDVEEAKLILNERRSYVNAATKRMIKLAAEHAILQKVNPRASFQNICFYRVEESVDREHIELLTRLLGRPVETVRFTRETKRSDIFGSASSAGLLVAALKRANCCNPVIFLENARKIKNKEVKRMLALLIDHTRRQSFVDEFIGVPFDFSNVIFVQISDAYMEGSACTSRCELVNCTITTEKKINVLHKKILPPILAEFGLENCTRLLDKDALACILDERNISRGFGKLVSTLRGQLLYEQTEKSKDPKRSFPSILEMYDISVKKPFIRFWWDRRRLELRTNGKMPVGAAPLLGIKTSTVEKGFIKHMQASFSKKRRIIETSVKKRAMIRIAYSYLRANAQRYRIPEEVFAKCFTVEYPSGDGRSAGCGTFLSLFSLFTNRRVRSDSATTGMITLSGRILPVCGVYEKTYAAYKAGIRKMVLPVLNKGSVQCEISGRLKNKMKFVYVETVDELVEAMTEK